MVKADGYGFGAAEVGAVFAASGADWLAVADLAEGLRLRRRGIAVPVLVYPKGDLEISPAEVAQRHGLGLHHVATTVGPRVARVYISGGVTVKVVTPA